MSKADYLACLLGELINGNPLSALTRDWLLRNLLIYLRAGGTMTLDEALGLSGQGVRSTHRCLALAMRNRHLRTALDTISIDAGVDDWARCRRLAEQVVRLLPVFSTTYRKASRPPDDWPVWKSELFHAWRIGLDVPATANGIHKAMLSNRSTLFSVYAEGLNVVASYAPQGTRDEFKR